MEKNREINILKTFIYWCLTALLICFVGVSDVFGAEYWFSFSDSQVYYNNNGSYGSTVGQTWNESLQAYVSNNIPTTANSYGGGVSFNSPIPLLSNHTYTMSISFEQRNNIALSSKNFISVADSASASANDYFNGNYGTTILYSKATNNSILTFTFKVNNNHTWLFVPFTTTSNSNQTYVMTGVLIDDLGSEGVSQQDINNSINSQTNVLNNSIQASTNTITGALQDTQDSLSQDIQDMGEDITGAINDNFNSCRDSYNLVDFSTPTLISPNTTYSFENNELLLNSIGTYTSIGYDVLDLLKNNIGKTLRFDFDNFLGTSDLSAVQVKLVTSATQYISLVTRNNEIRNLYISNSYSELTSAYLYIYSNSTNQNVQSSLTINKPILHFGTTKIDYEPYGEICVNKIDETNDKLDEAENTRKNIWQTIKDIPSNIGEMIKGLFIPEQEELEEIITEFKEWAELKFGILYDSIDIVVQFITNFNELTEGNDVIIHIPNITVPNFEDNIIIEEQDFNWSALLRSKQSFNTLWILYLDFIDVFIIIAFLNMCENVFSGITGEPQEPTDQIYESAGESYDVNDTTGEVTNHKIWRKESRRKR